MTKIIKGVPPPPLYRRGRHPRWPELAQLEIGESIAVELFEREPLHFAAMRYQRRTGKKFLGRTLGKMYQLWRIE